MHAPDPLLRALGDEILRVTRRRATTYPGSMLSTSAFRILWTLDETGPQAVGELADELHLEQSTVSRQVATAVRQGLLDRFSPGPDARVLLRPSAAGEEAYRHDVGIRVALFSEALEVLGADTSERLVRDLKLFNDGLDRALEQAAEQEPT
jgi:DNA-binding MarR family transcriptional regulator